MMATSKPAQSRVAVVALVPPRRDGRGEALVGDVLDVRAAPVQHRDAALVDVVPDDLVTALGGPDGERQADIPLSRNDYTHGTSP
jgi:hypothetical protein